VRDQGKDDDAHTSQREESSFRIWDEDDVAFDPISHQLVAGLKGEDRLVFGPMILKDSPDLFKKRDAQR